MRKLVALIHYFEILSLRHPIPLVDLCQCFGTDPDRSVVMSLIFIVQGCDAHIKAHEAAPTAGIAYLAQKHYVHHHKVFFKVKRDILEAWKLCKFLYSDTGRLAERAAGLVAVDVWKGELQMADLFATGIGQTPVEVEEICPRITSSTEPKNIPSVENGGGFIMDCLVNAKKAHSEFFDTVPVHGRIAFEAHKLIVTADLGVRIRLAVESGRLIDLDRNGVFAD